MASRSRSPRRPSKSSNNKEDSAGAPTVQDRADEWHRSRQLGYLSFLIPVAVILVLLTPTFGGDAATAVWSKPWGWEPVEKTVLYFSLWAFKEVLLNVFKYFLVTKGFGWRSADYWLMIGPRSSWTGKEVGTLLSRYGRYRTKVMDAINRRLGHTVINVFRIYFYVYLCSSNDIRLKTAMLQLPVISSLKILTESGKRFNDVGRFIFQGSRVFDGQYGRFNLVVVNFWAYAGRIIMFQLLVRSERTDDVKALLFALAMMPLLWGDSFGEIIGAFFGKWTFQVRGLGDVNTKTVEGTLAVFASSFVAQLFTFYYLFGMWERVDVFVYHPVVVFFYTCVIAAVVESAAPRSTDNFFLQVLSLVTLMASLA